MSASQWRGIGASVRGAAAEVAGIAKLAGGIRGSAELFSDMRAQRPDVGGERVEQQLVSAQDVARELGLGERGAVDQQRPGVGLLQVEDAADHRLELVLDVVRLVDRE